MPQFFSKRSAKAGNDVGVFEQYRPELRRFLRRHVREAHAANDLAQEVYLRLLRFPPEEVVLQPQAYLYRVASNVVHDFNLKVRDERVFFDSPTVDALAERTLRGADEDVCDQLDIEQEVERVLGRLPQAWRAALVLRKRDGMSYPEIAEALNVSVHTVKKYIARGVALCRTLARES